MSTFKVISSTQTKFDNFLVKVTKTTNDGPSLFGTTLAGGSLTYYMFLAGPVAVGTEGPIDISQFDIQIKEFTPEGGTPINLKYLVAKA
jgi:hypothetical protein